MKRPIKSDELVQLAGTLRVQCTHKGAHYGY